MSCSSSLLRLWSVVGALTGLALAPPVCAAEVHSDDYATREWHLGDGLPGEQITRIIQDADGYLWVAAIGGLARFDGAHFEKYALRSNGTEYARIAAASSKLGVIAAPLTRRGLVALRNGAFEPWRPEEFQDRVITGLFAEANGTLWISCDDGSLVRHADGKSTRFDESDGLPRARGRWFATDARGQLWIAGDGSVVHFRDGEFVPLPIHLDGSEVRIGSSRRGGPWLITADRLLRFDNEQLTEIARLPPMLGAHYVQAIQEDRDGTLWIGTRSQGLHVLTGSTLRQVPTTHEDIFALCEDNDGNLWVGTNGGGLDRIRKKTYRLYDKAAGLRDNQTHTVRADRDGSIWFANRDGGVARLNADGEMELLGARAAWPRLSTVSIFPLGEKKMGLTTATGNFAFSRDNPLDLEPIAGLPSVPVIRVTFVARNGDVWMSVDPDRVGRLRAGAFEVFGPTEGMDGRQIRGIAEDASGRIWIGAADGKLFRSDGERFETISLGDLNPGAIQAIHIEDDGVVWLGTVTGGIVMLANGVARSCAVEDGLPDANIAQILADHKGYLWFGSKHGIFRISRKEILDCLDGRIARVTPLVIGQDEGLKDISCQGIFQPAACESVDGRLWFATRRGVLSVDPSVQLASRAPPPVAIEEVRFDDTRVPLVRPFNVAANVRKLEIRFGVLNLSAPDRVHAKYRLDGFDDDWVPAPASRVAAYPRLPPGKYTFHVMATAGDGAVNETGDTLQFSVEPQWWQTWWFRCAATLLAALAVAFTVRAWSHRRLRARLDKLERERAVEQERRRIAQNIHDDLGASLTHISLLTQQARHENTAGAAFYDQIHQTAAEMTRSMDEIVWAVNPKYDDLESLAGYVGDFAQSFLGAAGIRCRLDVPDQLPPVALSSQMRHHLFLSCKEALNNVVKHAGADEVSISMDVQPDRLNVTIKDNGCGQLALSHTNGRAAVASSGARRIAGGAGLDNMRRRMEMLAGKCDIFSEEGQGVTVTFSVPLNVENT